MYFVYVLERQDGKLYIGQTENLEKRLSDHKEGVGARFTQGYPFILLGTIPIESRSAALLLEKKLKRFKNPHRVREYLGYSPDAASG